MSITRSVDWRSLNMLNNHAISKKEMESSSGNHRNSNIGIQQLLASEYRHSEYRQLAPIGIGVSSVARAQRRGVRTVEGVHPEEELKNKGTIIRNRLDQGSKQFACGGPRKSSLYATDRSIIFRQPSTSKYLHSALIIGIAEYHLQATKSASEYRHSAPIGIGFDQCLD